jgi:putative ABC transport system permease protein
LSPILRKAVRDLIGRRLRGLLTVAGILIGVAGIVAIISTSHSMADAQARAYNHASQADITILTSDAPDSLARQLLKLDNVAEVELRATYFTKWKVNGQWRDLYFIAFPDYRRMKIDVIELVKGDFPRRGTVVLEKSSYEVNPVPLGEDIVYRAYSGGQLREKTMTVVGIASTPVYPSAGLMNRSIAYASLEDVRSMLGIQGNNEIKVKLVDIQRRDETLNKIEDALSRRNLPVINAQKRDPNNYPGKRELDSLLLLMFLFSLLGLAISGFLVTNTLAGIIGEQVGEIGVMKALGGTRWQVVRIYLLEAFFYGLVGTGLGVVLGWAGGVFLIEYLARLMNLEAVFTLAPLALAAGVALGLVVSVGAALLPALSGTSVTVGEALASHGISFRYGQSWIDRMLTLVRGIPPSVAFSLRNAARRKGRSGATILVVALATAALFAALATDASLTSTIDKLYDTYDAEGFVWFEQRVGPDFAGAIRAVPEVKRVESWALSSAVVKGVKAQLKGIPADSRLYRKDLREGRWFRKGERDAMVVSTDLASRAGIRVGDVVEVDLTQRSTKFKVVGIVFDSSTQLGATTTGNAFLPPELVPYDVKGRATLFALKLDNPDPAHVDQVLGKIERKFRGQGPGTFSMAVDRENSRKQADILRAMVYGMVIIVGVVGGIGVLNTQSLNVLERRREIGVMRAIGASGGNLMQVFVAEGLFLGLVGGGLGIAVGYPLAQLFVALLSRYLLELEFLFQPELVPALAIYALVLATLASLLPAWGASQLSASQALRYE